MRLQNLAQAHIARIKIRSDFDHVEVNSPPRRGRVFLFHVDSPMEISEKKLRRRLGEWMQRSELSGSSVKMVTSYNGIGEIVPPDILGGVVFKPNEEYRRLAKRTRGGQKGATGPPPSHRADPWEVKSATCYRLSPPDLCR